MSPLLPRSTLLVACLALAGAGLAVADHANTDCRSPHAEEDADHPLREGYYLYVPQDTQDPEDMDKFGWWKETNDIRGLQTVGCSLPTGEIMYFADAYHGRLLV